MSSNIRKENEFIERATNKDYKPPSSDDIMKSIAGAWEELKCTHCGKRLTINQEHQNANMLYCNETCKRLHNSMAPIATCAYCGKEGSDVNNECNKCHTVKYCNSTCKKKHRKKHKKQCERIVANSSTKDTNIEEEMSFATRRGDCKGCRISNAKLSNGYCLMCDRDYNHGGSHTKQRKAHREEEEKDMNMDACYECQREDGEPLRKCDFCTRLYHFGCGDSSSPISSLSNKELKCDVCRSDEMWEKEEKEEEESPLSPPSLSNVSNANTVSNEQTLHNPHQAIGIEEETPHPDAILSKERIVSDGLSNSNISSEERLPSDIDIRIEMELLMQTVDLETMSTKQFISALSEKFNGVDLTSKKPYIKATMLDIIDSMQEQSNFESRLSDLLGQIHTESVDTTNQTPETPASLGGMTVAEYIKSQGGDPKWSNKLLMKAMGLEEETPSATAETQEEEDTSPSLSSSSNVNTVVDKDNRMFRLFESITIDDNDPDSDNVISRKDTLFNIMNNDDDHFVLSDEQQNDVSVWLDRCKEQMNDVTLFRLPPRPVDCPICHIQLPYLSSGKVYMTCCGRVICRGCIHTFQTESDDRDGSLCVFCKVPMPDSDEEIVKRYAERIVLHDSGDSACTLGCFYQSGMFGLPQSYSKALRLYNWATHYLLSTEASCNIADAYDRGLGVERDYEKAWLYYEFATMSGNVQARYNLGVSEMLVGNTERALKHFMIAVKISGCNESLKKIKQLNMNLHATNQEYLEALRAYNAHLFKIESPRRDRAAAFSNDYRYYEPLRGEVREDAERVEEKIPDGVKQDDIRLVMSQAGVSSC